MFYIKAYDKLHRTCDDYVRSRGERLLSYGSTIDMVVSIGHTLKFIVIWMQKFD